MLLTESILYVILLVFLQMYDTRWWRNLQHVQWKCEFSKKPFWSFQRRFSIFAPTGGARAIPSFSPSWGLSFFSNWYVLMVFSVFLMGRGQKEEAGALHMLQTINKITTNPQAADFSRVAFAALLYSCQFGVVELQAGKTRQPTSQKPCLLLLETWQCERCNWQVAMCNVQIELMDSSSSWISIGIHSYQSLMWNMQRLYRWGGMVVKPEIFPEVFPTKSCMHNPTSKSTKILPFYGCGVGVYESALCL